MNKLDATSGTSGQKGDRHEVSQNQRNSRAVPVLQMLDVRRYGRLLAKFTLKQLPAESR